MSELRKANTEHPYFLTLTVVGWIDIFTRKIYCDEVIKNLNYCTAHKSMELAAYVIMPSHIHLIARNQDCNLPNIIRDFKSYTAKRILGLIESENESRREWLKYLFAFQAQHTKQNLKHMFWQKTNYATELSNPKIFNQKIDYIHENPVVAGLVTEAESWMYSSACKYPQFCANLVE